MSLILRKECQPLLNIKGLGETHVAINGNKNLEIVGKCGQPLVSIHGISFTRREPSRAEITYCVELLEEFLDTHINEIVTYMNALQKFRALPIPDPSSKGYEISVPAEWEMSRGYKAKLTYEDFPLIIQIFLDPQKALSIDILDKVTIDDVSNYQFNPKHLRAARLYLTRYLDYEVEKTALSDMKIKLNTCEI